jgi:ribosomal protein L11 methyltransferase
MSRLNKPVPTWRWHRLIRREDEFLWTERLGGFGEINWMIVEKPGRVRLTIEAHFRAKKPALALGESWGGHVKSFAPSPPSPVAPVKVSARLEIAHDEKAARSVTRLVIPYGIAFGSGEHATTLMLLRCLSRHRDLTLATVLDLGTGSGVLALAARKLGARHIFATDFDASAIRTARQNEVLNFSSRRVLWEVADVKKLCAAPRYSLVLANLFSGILIEAAPRIARTLAPGGELWLSGVLRSQQEDVAKAFRRVRLRQGTTTTRGRWVMQQWAKVEQPTMRALAD